MFLGKRSHRIIAIAFMMFVGLGALSEGVTAAPQEDPTLENIEMFWDGLMTGHMNSTSITAATVTIVKDGNVIFEKGYGYSNIKDGTKVDPDTSLFRVGSVSKLFTYTAIMQLYEKGLLDLEGDVNQYLDGYQIPADKFGAPVSIRDLMTHSAGFEASLLGGFFNHSLDEVTPMVQSINTHTPERIRTSGMASSYSNFGITVLGRVVESISGRDFSNYIDDEIFKPLGMNNSYFLEPLNPEKDTRIVKAYSGIDGDKQELGFEYIGSWAAAGSMSSTSADMAKFMQAHLTTEATPILRQETLELMHSTAFAMHKDIAGMAHGFYEVDYNGYHALSHAGATSYFLSDLFLIPEENLGVFYSVTDGNGYVRIHEPFRAFMDHFYPRVKPRTPRVTQFDSTPFEGTFRYLRNNTSTVEKFTGMSNLVDISSTDDGSLYVNSSGRVTKFTPISKDLFERTDGNERLAFVKTKENDRYTFAQLSSTPYNSMQRISWYSKPKTVWIIIGFAIFMAAISLGCALLRYRDFKTFAPLSLWANVSNVVLASFTLAFVAYAYSSIKNLSGLGLVYDYFPTSIKIATLTAAMFIPLSVLHGYLYGRFVMQTNGFKRKKILFGANLLSVIALIWLCHYWNFIGYRY